LKEYPIRTRSLIASLLIALTISGCSGKPARIAPKNEIVVWHWLSDRSDAFDTLARKYKIETGVNVRFELYTPISIYNSKVRAAAQANKLPDIYGVLMEMKDFASLIDAGLVADLTPYMDENNAAWKNSFFKGGLIMNSFPDNNQYDVKPGIYGVPIDINNIQLLYNMSLLAKAGWTAPKPPSTWPEFLALGDMLKKAGIPGLVSGWGEPWLIHCFADNMAWNIMGKDKIIATIRGEVPYTDPDWVKVFDLFKQMKDHGLLSDGIVIMINKEAEQAFANERAAIAFNGSWGVNVYDSMNPELKYAVAMPPKVDPSRPMHIWGGTTSLMVNGRSPLKTDAVKFLEWLSECNQQTVIATETRNIPSTKLCVGVLKGPIMDFAAGMENVVHPRLLPVEEFPLVTEAFDKGIQSIIIGEATPETVARNVQDMKEREIKRAERFKVIKGKQ
jgi:ABC-type glycerol-3-phosphate transport system substrate-binding protein